MPDSMKGPNLADLYSTVHPHEPEIPKVLAEDGHCRICRMTVVINDLQRALAMSKSIIRCGESMSDRAEYEINSALDGARGVLQK